VRVGIAIPSLHGGGAELVTRQWANELHRRGHTVHLYVLTPRVPVPDGLLAPGITVHPFRPVRRAARLLGLPIWLRRRAKRDDLDVLVTMLTFNNLAALTGWRIGRRPRCKLLISERNSPTIYTPIHGRKTGLQVPLARRAYRWADAVIAISHPIAAELVSSYGVAADRCIVVPNPASSGTALAEPAGRVATTVALVGRLVPQKRPERLVEALAILAADPRAGAVRGVVIGTGRGEASLRDAARDAGVPIEFLGWQEPWRDAAVAAGVDVVLLPSDIEGFGNVLVEAAAAGIPSVAASPALGVADAVVPGITGELAPTTDPHDLAAAILRAADLDLRAPQLDRWLARFAPGTSVDVLERAFAVSLGSRSATPHR
jgi:glycosyltransferase involved in cell wall biosynthesis